MTLTVRLNSDEERKLDRIVQLLKRPDVSTVIRDLINEKWAELQPTISFVERRGGAPAYFGEQSLNNTDLANLSDREYRKAAMKAHYQRHSDNRTLNEQKIDMAQKEGN